MTLKRKNQICDLLKSLETGEVSAVSVVNSAKYIQHNPQTQEGGEGLAALFKRLSKTSPRVNTVRVFSDGDFVFAHTEYDFATSRIGFEIFRFEGEQTVEHWDNIQPRMGPNVAGHSMVSGVTEVSSLEKTENNRELVRSFVTEVIVNQKLEKLSDFIEQSNYIEHNPNLDGNLTTLTSIFSKSLVNNEILVNYQKIHRILADGNFVLTVSEGYVGTTHSSFFDLFRVENDKIVEHWDTTEAIPSISEWKNDNGKF